MFSLGGGEKRGHWNENIFPGDILSSSFVQIPAFSRVGGGIYFDWCIQMRQLFDSYLHICMHQRNVLTVKFAFCLLCHCAIYN